MPMISARDWVDAVIHLAETEAAQGPFNLCCERRPPTSSSPVSSRSRLHRPAFCRVPGVRAAPAAGQMSTELLGSINCVPAELLDSGFTFSDPDVEGRAARGARTQPLTVR